MTMNEPRRPPDPPAAALRACLIGAAVWLTLGAGFGLTAALKLVAPEFLGATRHHSYPVMRIAHMQGMAFGALLLATFAGAAALLPSGNGAARAAQLIRLAGWLVHAAVLAGVALVSMGEARGVTWSEVPPLDSLLVCVALALVVAALRTAGRGPLASTLTAALAATLLAVAVPACAPALLPALPAGALVIQSPHLLLAVGFFLAAVAAADRVAMVLLPRRDAGADTTVTLVVTTLAVGPLASFRGPSATTPGGALGVLGLVAIAVWSVALVRWTLDLIRRMLARPEQLIRNVAVRHLALGLAFLLLLILQSLVCAWPALRDRLASTDVRIAHAHLGLAGVVLTALLAGAWHDVCDRRRCHPASPRLLEAGFWCLATGIAGMVFSLIVAGVLETQALAALRQNADVIAEVRGPWWVRLLSGTLMSAGLACEAWAMVATWRRGRPIGPGANAGDLSSATARGAGHADA